MTSKTVDVICSLEGGFPIILEVLDTENIEFSIKRQEYYKNYYDDVHLFAGVDFVQED